MTTRAPFVGVCAEKCGTCLFGERSLVPPIAVAAVVAGILREDSYFTCHQATARDVDAMCRGWWDEYREDTIPGRIAIALGIEPNWTPEGAPTNLEYAEELAWIRRTDWAGLL